MNMFDPTPPEGVYRVGTLAARCLSICCFKAEIDTRTSLLVAMLSCLIA